MSKTVEDHLTKRELYEKYAPRLLTLCRRYCDSVEEAEDLLQDTFLTAFDKKELFTYRGEGSLYAWLSRIAVNLAVDRIRKSRWNRLPIRIIEETVSAPSDEELEQVSQEKMLDFIASLPKMQRTVFNLYCMDGYSHRNIGKILGISEKGSASILAKARNRLKRDINNYIKEQENGTLGTHHQG